MELKLLRCKIRFIFIIIFLLTSLHSFSQNTISGLVLNYDNEPLSYATVTAYNEDGTRLITYAISDENGKYTLELEDGIYFFKVSFLGYEPFTGKKNISEGKIIDFELNKDAASLDVIEVKSKSLDASVRNDTTKYNLKYLTNGTEENLKDVLNKLPGVEIDENGKIKANGKKIDKLLIDGKEFFGDQHQLATENIGSEMVEGISLLANFNDFTNLESQSKSGKTAMNIEIDEDYKGNIKGNVAAGGGYENRYEVSTNLFSFREKTNLFFIGSSNNIGNQTFSFEDYISFQGGIQKLMSDNSSSATILEKDLPSYLFSDENVKSKNEQFSALNFSYTPSSKFKLNSYVIFDRKKITEEQLSKQTYFTKNENITLDLDNSSENKFLINNSFIDAIYKPNSNTILEYTMNFSPQKSDLFSADNFDLEKFNTVRNDQSYSLNQILNYKQKFNKYLFSTTLFHSKIENDYDLDLSSNGSFLGLAFQNNDYSTFQTTQNSSSSFGINTFLSRKITKNTSFKVIHKLSNRNEAFQSDVSNNSLNNNAELDVLENQIGINFYNKEKKSINYEIGSFYNLWNSNQTINSIFLPFINLKYNFRKTHSLNISYNKTLKLPRAENIIEESYISNFNTLINNQNIVPGTFSKYDNFGIRYFIYDLFSGTLLSFGGNFIFGKDIIATNTINFSNSRINNFSLGEKDKNINAFLLFDKKFSKIPFKIRLKNTITFIEKNNFINAIANRYNSKILSNSINIASNFRESLFNFEIGYKRKQNIIDSKSININSRVTLNEPYLNLFFNTKQFDFSINSSIESYNSNVLEQQFYRIDPALNYKTKNKRWTFYIKGIDVLNMNKNYIIENTVFENFIEEKKVSILGGFIISGFRFKF